MVKISYSIGKQYKLGLELFHKLVKKLTIMTTNKVEKICNFNAQMKVFVIILSRIFS